MEQEQNDGSKKGVVWGKAKAPSAKCVINLYFISKPLMKADKKDAALIDKYQRKYITFYKMKTPKLMEEISWGKNKRHATLLERCLKRSGI